MKTRALRGIRNIDRSNTLGKGGDEPLEGGSERTPGLIPNGPSEGHYKRGEMKGRLQEHILAFHRNFWQAFLNLSKNVTHYLPLFVSLQEAASFLC